MRNEPLIPEAEQIVHMWEPLPFTVDEKYDYLRTRWYQRFGSGLLRAVAAVILTVYNGLVLGVRVHGRKNLKALGDRGAVGVCNHVHPMDCTMVDLAVLPKRIYFVSLDTNFRIPVARHIIRWLGAVPMSRSPKQIRALFAQMGKAIRQGAVAQVYPEGVLAPYHTDLREFHNGAFRLAVEADAPVLPMVIVQSPPKGLYRLYKRKPCLHVHILPPIYPNKDISRREAVVNLRNQCRAVMEQKIVRGKGEKSAADKDSEVSVCVS